MSVFKAVMYDYKWKKAWLSLALAGAAGVIIERIHSFALFPGLIANAHNYLFQWILLLGLFGIIFCKEKHEDERTKAIRARAFQVTFILQQGALLSNALVLSLGKKEEMMHAHILFIYAAMGIFFYLFLFHASLYFDFLIEYDGEPEQNDNVVSMRKIGGNILAFIALLLVLLLVIFLFSSLE